MNKLAVPFFIGLAVLSTTEIASAQLKIVVTIDTAYAHTGKVETSIGALGNQITDFYGIFPDTANTSKVTICGKIWTTDSLVTKFGLFQLNPNGTFDSTFGKNGIVIVSWGVSDYPNSMYVNSHDSSIVIAGMSAPSAGIHLPALFKFKKNGQPDSSFDGDGHVAVRYDSASSGEFTSIYHVDTTFLACGNITSDLFTGHEGFCAMHFFANGKLDLSFGTRGKAIIPLKVHSVSAFLTRNASITFIGVANKTDSEPPPTLPIVLARMTSKGLPDSTFGKNGVITTTKLVNENFGTMVAGIQPDYKIVAALPPIGAAGQMPITLVRFTSAGVIDTDYGTKGFVTVGFAEGQSRALGINIAKNAKTVVAGSSIGSLEQCATSRSNLDGSPDITFNQIGHAVIDVDSGAYSNSLIRFVGIGNKRYIGVGTSVHSGISEFLIARFKDDSLKTGSVMMTDKNSEVNFYPNPVTSIFTIETQTEITGLLKIFDELGREVKLFPREEYSSASKCYSLDVSNMINGIYYCVVPLGKERVVRKFIVAH